MLWEARSAKDWSKLGRLLEYAKQERCEACSILDFQSSHVKLLEWSRESALASTVL